MRAFDEYRDMGTSFWALVKYVSENLGYSEKGKGRVKQYSFSEIQQLCKRDRLLVPDGDIMLVSGYSKMRAELLNDYVERMLMDGKTAEEEYHKLELLYRTGNYSCKIPLNKQKGEMRQVAYFTAMINILTEKTIRELTGQDTLGFDDDPHGLVYVWNDVGRIIGASSRRFDGAYPSIKNPKLIWEIKEYYYATTFGSRVADGVYETQLDGLELKDLYDRTGRKVYHVLLIDAYRTWWLQGKSYLCRITDALNSGIIDEVIVGREVLTRWPELLRSVIEEQ